MQESRPNPWLYRFSLLVALFALVLIGTGAFLTSSRKTAESTEQAATAAHTSAAAVQSHLLVLVIIIGILTLGLAVWLLLADKRASLRWLSSSALVIFGLEGATAMLNSAAGVVIHACLAPLFFSTLVAICVLLSPSWRKGAEPVDIRGWSRLRALAVAAPPAVLIQIALGAAYRHKVTSVMPHMAGAMIVSFLTLVVSVIILQQYPDYRSLRSAAVAVLSIVLTQVTLGVTAFVLELLDIADPEWLIVSTVSHVLVGSLTLAATLVLAMQTQRNIRPTSQKPVAGTV